MMLTPAVWVLRAVLLRRTPRTPRPRSPAWVRKRFSEPSRRPASARSSHPPSALIHPPSGFSHGTTQHARAFRVREKSEEPLMNELKIGDVTVTRIEEMHGPIMPPDQFFPEIPEQAWRENREMLVPDHLGAGDGRVRGA